MADTGIELKVRVNIQIFRKSNAQRSQETAKTHEETGRYDSWDDWNEYVTKGNE